MQPIPNARTNSIDLSDRQSRISFLSKVLLSNAKTSQATGCSDYRDSMPRLAAALADIIGERRGAYRDQAEGSQAIEKITLVTWGFLCGVEATPPDQGMVRAWAHSVVQEINKNFRS